MRRLRCRRARTEGVCRRSAAFASAASLIFIFVDEIMAVSLCFYFASPTKMMMMMMKLLPRRCLR